MNLQKEAKQRRKVNEHLKSEEAERQRLNEITDKSINELERGLETEELTRRDDNEAQQRQLDLLAKAGLQEALNLSEEAVRRRSADEDEVLARTKQREVLQSEIDELSNAALRQDLNIQRETQTRREELLQVKTRLNEQMNAAVIRSKT